jgi:kynurenine formamidase
MQVVDASAANRLRALELVREGRLYDLGRVLDERVPAFPGRYFRQSLVVNPTPLGANELTWAHEVFTATTQMGTHLDTLGHLHAGRSSLEELAAPHGLTRRGAETLPQIVTRGWLVDAAPLERGEVIGPDALAGIDPEPGDAVLFHTGWGARWDDADAYLDGQPGPGRALADRLAERGVALTGADTWSYGPVPAENPERPFEVPQRLNVDHGVLVVENLDLSELARDAIKTFALVLTFPKLRGATGAWTSPIALV